MSELGLKEVVAMGVGGIIGGGIFAVLGVAANLSGNAAPLTYFLAGLIALISGYSYYQLTAEFHEEGGSFTFLEHYVSNQNIAGMVGWILVLGYVGTMAMYAYAFGSFAAGILGIGGNTVLRGLISVVVILLFVGINFLGTKESGSSEDLMVYTKVLTLLFFSAAGIWRILSRPELNFFPGGVFNNGAISAITAVGVTFVSFEGFQLLTYEYREMERGLETLKKGIMASIAISTLIYILIAVVTTNLLSPEQIIQHKETVLAFVASKIFSSLILNQISSFLISIAAIFSTASAINATMFGTARLTNKMANDGELPKLFSFRNKEGIPTRSLIIIAILTSLFTFLGSLEEITAFASLSFITIFIIVNYLAMKESEKQSITLLTGAGLIGSTAGLLLLLQHLYTDKIHVLIFVLIIFAILLLLEFLYFERDKIEKELEEAKEEIEQEL